MAFPDQRDRNLIRRAEQVERLATDLCDWLSEFNPARRETDLVPVAESDEFEVLQLRRLAGSLYTSAKVPVAAAAYGASQVGKSLFMGQVLRPRSERLLPHRRRRNLGEPAYYREPLLRQRPEPAVRLAGGHRPGYPLHHEGPHRRRRLARIIPVMVRALTRASSGCGCWPAASMPSAKRRPGPGSRANWRSSSRTSIAGTPATEVDRKLADGPAWTPIPTCGTSIAAASRRPRRS